MKLIYRLILRLSLVLIPLLLLWSTIFYFSMVNEINDESDDSLRDYAELIIRRAQAGRELPRLNNGSNNSYAIEPVESKTPIEPRFYDDEVYIPEKDETEPARVLETYFFDNYGIQQRLTVAMPTFEREDLIESILLNILLLYLLLVVTVIIVVSLIFYRNLRPLYKILEWLDSYLPGRKNDPVPNDSNVTEFRKLSDAIEGAVKRLESYSDMQKEFIGNASHELQTPLAVLGNRIEWLADNTSLTEEQAAELSKMRLTLNSLIRLNRTLLMLTKIENRQFPDVASINIASVIRDEVEIYSEIFSYKNIECSVNVPDDFSVVMNEALAKTLMTNLIKNAFLHSADAGKVEITIKGNVLSVANSGEGGLDRERLFDRFYHRGAHGSTGLGLALVKSICELYNYGITYSYSQGRHIFEIAFAK